MMLRNNKIGKGLEINLFASDDKQSKDLSEGSRIKMKRIFSTRNVKSNHKHFDFDFKQKRKTPNEEFRKSRKLEKDNDILYKSLIALKTGAVSVIAEKQQEIDQLKSEYRIDKIEQEVMVIEKQLQQLYNEREDMSNIIKELEQKIEAERKGYIIMLEQKERLIEQLYAQLGQAQLQIENLEKCEFIKDRKLRIIEQENGHLFQQLQEQKQAHLGSQPTHIDSEQPHFQTCIQQMLQTSFSESPTLKKLTSTVDTENINQLEIKHKQQIHQLAAFYQRRLSQIRELYEKELNLSSSSKEHQDEIRCINEDGAIYSKKDTVVVPKKLSLDLINFPQLSQCYSGNKNNFSKIDSMSIYTVEKGRVQTEDKFSLKIKAIRKPSVKEQSNNTKETDTIKKSFIIESPLRNNSKDIKQSYLTALKIKSFFLGAVVGGALMTAICKRA